MLNDGAVSGSFQDMETIFILDRHLDGLLKHAGETTMTKLYRLAEHGVMIHVSP